MGTGGQIHRGSGNGPELVKAAAECLDFGRMGLALLAVKGLPLRMPALLLAMHGELLLQ